MSTNDIAVTAAEYAAGLRALADLIEEHGLPASRRHPKQALTTTIFVESVAAVKDFAATHDLTVTVNENHTTAQLAAGTNPNTYYKGTAVLSVVHIDKAAEPAEVEPEVTGVAEYRCPEPGCDYHMLAAGPQDPDEPDYYAEGIDAHERGHAATATRTALADEFATFADELTPAPALVQLDQADAAERLSEAADTLDAAVTTMPSKIPAALTNFRSALADFRAVTR